MNSMTGYGKAEHCGDIGITVEIRTVNNRYFDLNPKYPRVFLAYDDAIRKCVQEGYPRGHADLYVTYTDNREKAACVTPDLGLANAYYLAGERIAEKTGAENDLTVSALLRFPDVVKTELPESDEETGKILLSVIKEAVANLNLMRKAEGEKLKEDMLSRIDTIEKTVEKIALRAPVILAEYREKIRARIEEYLKTVPVDEGRMLNEVATFTDRCNIDEELTRLRSHIVQFRKIAEDDAPGKKLDFLIQEFNRESNTICSKSNDAQTTDLALSLKNEIEKIREQVQNVE